jgi:Nif-specific regulatory protein
LLHAYCSRSDQSLDIVSLEIVLAVADQMGRTLESLRQKESLQAGLKGEREISRALRNLLETEGSLIGEGAKMLGLRSKLARLAASDATVLVRGESGVGKELACRELHFRSNRRNGPFVCLNCAAIPETLLESELFGHEKGAFTGATGQKTGKFELADGGTLFLDEVGELPLSLQARFLRVLEGQAFERVGGNVSIRPNVRIVAATNRDLEAAVKAGQFRQDLFYRLQVLEVLVPPLREHLEDLPELACHFLMRACQRLGRPALHLTPEALRSLAEYSWPGNVRELRSVMERAAILSDKRELQPGDLQIRPVAAQEVPADGHTQPPYVASSLDELERHHILQTLRMTNWVKREAARILGINRSTLDRKLERYGLGDPRCSS